MKSSYASAIRNRIENAPDGTVFVNSDFADIASSETIRKNINRLVQEGKIRRLTNGITEKPRFSKLLNENVAADLVTVAQAIARSYHWDIAPSENTALNMLGLSTQVPNSMVFVSSGPYRQYKIGNRTIEFKHRTNKDVVGLSHNTALLVQAIKALGKDKMDQDMIKTLSSKFSVSEKREILSESSGLTFWIRDTIRNICLGESNND